MRQGHGKGRPVVNLRLIGPLCSTGLLLLVLTPPGLAAEQRAIDRIPGVKLESRIRQEDREVTLRWNETPPLEMLPATGQPESTANLEWAKAVFVLRVETIAPTLTIQGDWITSTVEGAIEEVVFDKSPVSLKARTKYSFTSWDGTMVINGARVTAVIPWKRPLERGARYLVFADFSEQTKELFPAELYQVGPRSKLRAVSEYREHIAHAITGSTLDEAIRDIRQRLK